MIASYYAVFVEHVWSILHAYNYDLVPFSYIKTLREKKKDTERGEVAFQVHVERNQQMWM